MKPRPRLESVSIYLLLALIGFMLADLGILTFRDRFLPTAPPPPRRMASKRMNEPQRSTYNVVTGRNIFNADQKIPPPFGASTDPSKPAPDAPPVPSTLPLQLMGTIVHVNAARSIATINLKDKNDMVPVKVDGVIPENVGTVTKIERNKVIFRNNMTQRLEYIEMKEEGTKINFGVSAFKPQQVGEVLKKGETEFELKRGDIDRLTSNLPDLLQQARAVPRMGPNGQIECWNIADLQQGSLYERLGIKRGDCIKSVNGEKVDSPAKAMELYNALRSNSNAINIGIERSGRDENFNYNISN